ncbi:hypothetical protein C7408_12424 [Paraburkholderia caballeronis]|nr:hypothetical protein C7408_12424 [Paraburkholderia caballeronis]TDV09583.1 hypothetical protein C7406_12624 [Paraburkholderia caballeronis]TDV21648.1 hypothetical protein C7404_12124 [Paraburkholderia caballeronis]
MTATTRAQSAILPAEKPADPNDDTRSLEC